MSAPPKRRRPPAVSRKGRPPETRGDPAPKASPKKRADPPAWRRALASVAEAARGDPQADRVVPPTGYTALLTIAASAIMAFLAVLALALSLSAARVASDWSDALARTSTIRISPDATDPQTQVDAVLLILQETPGVGLARAIPEDERRALLEPWFGPDLPLDGLPIPELVAVTEEGRGFDAEGLRLRLQAEVPGAVLDDHGRWRRPLAEAAGSLRTLGAVSLLLIVAATAATVTLAASSALAANAEVIRVLRLVGARDVYIARAFTRRFTLRALAGAAIGTGLGMIAAALLPSGGAGFLGDVGFSGTGWLAPLLVPPLAALVGFAATRAAAMRVLKALP